MLRIVHVYPTVLGLYGDRGNALVLASRADARPITSRRSLPVTRVRPLDAVSRSLPNPDSCPPW